MTTSSGQFYSTTDAEVICGIPDDATGVECTFTEVAYPIHADYETGRTWWACPVCDAEHESTTYWLEERS